MNAYSTEKLQEGLKSKFRGIVAEAEYLLKVDPEDRVLVAQNATAYTNRVAGQRYSDSLWSEVSRYLGNRVAYRAKGRS